MALSRNKLRTFLTGFAISWGIFILIVLLAAGNGLMNGVSEEFSDQSTNVYMIYGGETSIPFKGHGTNRSIRFTDKDIRFLETEVKEVDQVSPRIYQNGFANFGDKSGSIFVQGVRPVFKDINNTLEIRLCPNREIQNQWIRTQTFTNHINTAEEISTNTIHLIDKANTRNIIAVGLTPNGFSLWLHTGHRFENRNRAVQNTQRTFHFHCKVHVPRGINQIDTMVAPETCRCRRSNCNTTFLFLFHPIHCRGAVMHFANFICFSGIEQNTFRSCGFTGIDVCHNADISIHM